MDFKDKPHGYWQRNKLKTMRAFLEDFARKKELDPLLPDTWYNIARKDIQSVKVSMRECKHIREEGWERKGRQLRRGLQMFNKNIREETQ